MRPLIKGLARRVERTGNYMEGVRKTWNTCDQRASRVAAGPAEGRMRTSKFSTLLVSALAALALAATGCSKKSGTTTTPPACEPNDSACTTGGECCSGNCD